MTNREFAEAVASDLFHDDSGSHARRLVMEYDSSHYGGPSARGWSEPAVRDRIERLMKAYGINVEQKEHSDDDT